MTTETTTDHILEARQVTVKFGGLTAVDGVSFVVKQGELLGLIGPNGAGKTTMFNVIAGVIRPTEGQIHFEEQRIDGHRPDQIGRLGIGRTFQLVRLFNSMTVLENVTVASSTVTRSARLAQQKALETVKLVGLGEQAHQPVSALPLGDRKRTEIARALATNPRLLLLDEMMSGLNPAETETIVALISRLNSEGLAIIVIEHVLRIVNQLSHRIVVLNNGHLIAEGTSEEVMENPQVIEAYIGRRHSA